ncbi:MAG: ABC transporter permease [Stellaceae bacterium]
MTLKLDRQAYYWPGLIGFAILFVANFVANPIFVQPDNWLPVLLGAAPFIITTWAETVPILSGNGDLDLSVGPLAGLVNAVVAFTLPAWGITDPVSMIVIALAIGVASGLLNGFLVTIVRVQPIIATLGTFLTYQGLTLAILPTAGGSAPPWMGVISGNVFGVPGILYLFLIIAVCWWLLGKTAYRRNLLAVGGDIRAAYTAGINVTAVRITAFVIAGVLAAITGIVFTATLGSADPTVGTPYILTSIAGVALGGIGFMGGSGGLLGAAAGGAMLFLIENLFSLAQVSIYYIQIAYGSILLAALAINSITDRMRRRRAAAALM